MDLEQKRHPDRFIQSGCPLHRLRTTSFGAGLEFGLTRLYASAMTIPVPFEWKFYRPFVQV